MFLLSASGIPPGWAYALKALLFLGWESASPQALTIGDFAGG